MDNMLKAYVEKLKLVDTVEEYEAFREVKPNKRATLTSENLKKIKIENEYDLQHLLYAVIKPLYPDARREVSEDSGVGTVRSFGEIELT